MERAAARSGSVLFVLVFSLILLLLGWPFLTSAQHQSTQLAAYKQIMVESTHGTWTLKEGPAGTLYVLHRSVPNSSVWMTDYSGTSPRMIVSTVEYPELRTPRDLGVDRDGNVIVLNGDGSVMVFSKDGKLQGSFQAQRPHAVAVLSDGRILVSGFPKEHLMSIYNREGNLLGEMGAPVKVDTSDAFDVQIMNMGSIVVDGDDNIYYIFRYLLTPTVRKYTRDGNLVAEWHAEGAHLEWTLAQAKQALQRNLENGQHGASAVFTGGAFDNDTKTLWLGSNQDLFELDSSGHAIRNLSLTTAAGRPVQAFGLAVNRDFLCAAGPGSGTVEFLKPH